MNSYNSFDFVFNLWGRPEFPDRLSTRSFHHDPFSDPADVYLQFAIECFHSTCDRAENEDPLRDPRLVSAPNCFALACLTAIDEVSARS